MSGPNETPFVPVAPEPLVRPPQRGADYPIGALPRILADGVRGVVARTQCPVGLAANSVVGAASLVSQAHVNVPGLGGSIGPASLFLLTVAQSGERKSSADALAMKPVKDWEREQVSRAKEGEEAHRRELAAYEASLKSAKTRAHSKVAKGGDIKAAMREEIEALGEPPKTPIRPNLICDEPTVEGLWMLLSEGMGTAGVFSAEGGAFVGGHAMNADNRLKSAALLSQMWDGEPLRRVRVTGVQAPLYGRRVSMHLMGQPEAMAGFAADPTLRDQGLLGRFLWACPESTMGTRFQRDVTGEEELGLGRFHRALKRCLAVPIPRAGDDERACEPRLLELDAEASRLVRAFADDIERELAPGGEFASITGPAAKLAEQALRIAGVFTFIASTEATKITADTMESACKLAAWHGGEALRLFNAGVASPEIAAAEELRLWLSGRPERDVLQSLILTHGPNRLRDAKALSTTLRVLAEAGWVTKVSERPAAWCVWREGH